MAQLNEIRQRINTIETIKKITHAMRLISISTHSKLKNKKEHLENYKNHITELLLCIAPEDRLKQSQKATTHKENLKELIILVGSEKGLAGSFNAQLFKFFELNKDITQAKQNVQIITVGKHATDYILSQDIQPIQYFNTLNSNNFIKTANAIASHILDKSDQYNNITTYSNMPKTFFIQKPHKKSIWPLQDSATPPEQDVSCKKDAADYIFEQRPDYIYNKLTNLYLKTVLQETLFNSLLAEQAARFVSMDSSTRNADKLLASTKLEYNKERQTLITRELTELSSNYL